MPQEIKEREKYAYEVISELNTFLHDYGAEIIGNATIKIKWRDEDPIITTYEGKK
jgi:hypothetical protein